MSFRRGGGIVAVSGGAALYACSSFSASDDPAPDGGTPDGGTPEAAVEDAAVDAGFYAKDSFERVVADGLGTAEIGGNWYVGQSDVPTAVSAGTAHFVVARAATNGRAYLTDVKARDVEMHARIHAAKVFPIDHVFASLHARSSADTERYYASVALKTGAGHTTLSAGIGHPVGVAATSVSSVVVEGLDVEDDASLEMRVQV